MLNPYAGIGELKTFKGDLHFHSTRSDGQGTAEEMLERLVEYSFNFCCLADHDLPVSESYLYKDLLVLAGQEMSAETGHIVSLFPKLIRDEQWSTSQQLKAISEAGGYAILAHPKIREFTAAQGLTYTAERLVSELQGLYGGMEIYTHNVGSGLKLGIDRLDVVWTSSLCRRDAPGENTFQPVWGFATSDGHHIEHITENVGIIVWSDKLSQQSLMDSITSGAFYSLANTRARFSEIEVDHDRIYASASEAIMIRAIKSGGLPVEVVSKGTADLMDINYHIRGDEGYIRIEAMDVDGHCAYTNPVFLGAA